MSLPLIFYHSPNSRSVGTRILLQELDVPYELCPLNMKAGEQRQAKYLAINPMGKVPAIKHGDTLVTEQVAVFLYLADAFPKKGLAPAIGDPLRGAYLRWMVYYSACFEPAVMDRAKKREPVPPSMCPYGDFDTMWKTLIDQLGRGPYILGDRFSAADVLWGTALGWMTLFKTVPETDVVTRYVARVHDRPAAQAARVADKALAENQARASQS